MAANIGLKITFLVIIGVDLLLGLACLGVGIWFHASADIRAYLTVFVQSKNDQMMLACAAILLSTGLILSLLTAFAATGAFLNDAKYLKLFLAFIWIVMALGLICGFIAVGFEWDIHRFVSNGMKDQLQNSYTWDNRVGIAWNRLQVKKRCCGVDGPWDYLDSDWFAAQNPDPVNRNYFVPDSCCALNFNQDRELSWVDPQKPELKDKKRCNEDAEGNKSASANLNGLGCFSALFGINKDNWHDTDILTIIHLIEGLGIAAGFFQLVPILLALMLIRDLISGSSGKSLPGRY